MKFLSFALLVMALLASQVTLAKPALAQKAAQDVCFARWNWIVVIDPDTLQERGFWQSPFAANLTGALDLRSLPQMGSPGPTAQGWGLFAYDQPMGATGMHCLGGDLDAPLTATQVDTLALILGKPAGSIRSRAMRMIIRELLTTDADPTGQTFWKPSRISREDGFRIALGGYGDVVKEPFSESHPAFQATLDVRHADYRRHKAAGVPLEVLQRWTGFDAMKLFGRRPTQEDLQKLLPPESVNDGWLVPRSTFGDTFVEGVNTNLEDHTPTGANAGTSWALVEGAAGAILVNAANDDARFQAGSPASYRMEDDLSSDDHYAEAKIGGTVNNTSHALRGAVAVRFAAAAATYYDGGFNRASDLVGDYLIFKTVTGTPTELATVDGTDGALNNICRLEVSGSDLELFAVDGATSKLTVTDTAITGNLRGGIRGQQSGVDRWRWDDFEEADVGAAPPAVPSQVIIIN